MDEIVQALKRALFSLKRGKIWFYLALPAALAAGLMLLLGYTLLGVLIAAAIEYPPISWVNDWGAFLLAKILAAVLGWAVIISVSYLLSLFLAAVVTSPALLAFLVKTEYPELEKKGVDRLAAAVWNSASGIFLFVLGWLFTLPLWLFPGASIILPLLWMAWLNQRTFSYDVLTPFATNDEARQLKKQHGVSSLALGAILSATALLPFVGLLAPSFALLAYSHFYLAAIERLRQTSPSHERTDE